MSQGVSLSEEVGVVLKCVIDERDERLWASLSRIEEMLKALLANKEEKIG